VARVWAALSGGVDSSLAAALLVEAGHEVTGVTMRLLPEDVPGGCCPSGSVRDAKRVCDHLGVPHYTLDLREAFEDGVITPFCDEYAAGRTPNPCVECNDVVKLRELLRRALENGADLLATGHYARVTRDLAGEPWLESGADEAKDQSYFLYRATSDQLAHLVLPVGEMLKSDVRAAASERGLPTAGRPESQEACFLAGVRTREYVRERRRDAFVAGEVRDAGGRVLGHHDGAAGYTVGQRKGLAVTGAGPTYVLSTRPTEGVVVVGPRAGLQVSRIVADRVVWRGGSAPSRVTARARYRSPGTAATAHIQGQHLVVDLDSPVAAVAPGQALVCWEGTRVVGGGRIRETE
jgi:tRNA-specific 2-thiouridylase